LKRSNITSTESSPWYGGLRPDEILLPLPNSNHSNCTSTLLKTVLHSPLGHKCSHIGELPNTKIAKMWMPKNKTEDPNAMNQDLDLLLTDEST